MEVAERRLNIIEKLLHVQDEQIFQEIENILTNKTGPSQFSKLSKEDLIERAQQANLDIKEGRTYSIKEASDIMNNW